MTKVFIGGSRSITRLNKNLRQRVDDLLKEEACVLIGDANGADKMMQTYFLQKQYRNVIVFCTGNTARNNLGNWELKRIYSDRANKDFAYYTAKDLEMSKEADRGFMLWDGKSKGTLNNILNLLEHSKKVRVYLSPKRLFVDLHSVRDLTHFLKHCDPASLDYFDKTLHLHDRLSGKQEQLSYV